MNTLSNDELIKKIKELRGEEKRILALLLEYLHELDNRKLYRELGYPSLFAFCTKALGYSEGAAFRRIAAARALSVCPELCHQIETGKLSLCTAAEVAKVLTVENKEQVLAAGAGKSNRAVRVGAKLANLRQNFGGKPRAAEGLSDKESARELSGKASPLLYCL